MEEQSRDYTNWAIGAMVIMGLFVGGMAIRQKVQRRAYLQKVIKQRIERQAEEKRALEEQAMRKEMERVRPNPNQPVPPPPAAVLAVQSDPNKPNALDEFHQKMEAKSKAAIENFQKMAYLKFTPPHRMQFREYEGFDGMAGVYGTNHDRKTAALALGYPKNVSPADGEKFLKSQATNFPHMRGADLSKLAPGIQLPPPPEGSGLSGGTLWSGKLNSTTEFHAVMLPRADGLGTYMLIMTGPPSYFQGADFEDSYNQLQAVKPSNQQ